MHFARRQLNTTVLPDGTVLVTGGSEGPGHNNENAPVLAAESQDPEKDAWTTLSSAAEYRGHHSTAVLLPDGRVLTGGSTTRRVCPRPQRSCSSRSERRFTRLHPSLAA